MADHIWLLTTLTDDFAEESRDWLTHAYARGWLCNTASMGCSSIVSGQDLESVQVSYFPKRMVHMTGLAKIGAPIVSLEVIAALGAVLESSPLTFIPILEVGSKRIIGARVCHSNRPAVLRGYPEDGASMRTCPVCRRELGYAGTRPSRQYVLRSELHSSGLTLCQTLGFFVSDEISERIRPFESRKGIRLLKVHVRD